MNNYYGLNLTRKCMYDYPIKAKSCDRVGGKCNVGQNTVNAVTSDNGPDALREIHLYWIWPMKTSIFNTSNNFETDKQSFVSERSQSQS